MISSILRKLVTLGAATAAVAAAAPAQAWENPGQTPVVDSILVEALDPSARYWQRTTGQTPCNPELFMYDSGQLGRLAEATFPEHAHCAIWFDRTWWKGMLGYLAQPDTAPWAAWMIAQVVTHERGHNLGIHHTVGGLMDAGGTAYVERIPEAVAWADTSPWLRNHTVAPPTPDVAGSNAPRPVMTVSDRVPSLRVARLAPRVRRCQRARYRRTHRASCARIVRQHRAAKAAGR